MIPRCAQYRIRTRNPAVTELCDWLSWTLYDAYPKSIVQAEFVAVCLFGCYLFARVFFPRFLTRLILYSKYTARLLPLHPLGVPIFFCFIILCFSSFVWIFLYQIDRSPSCNERPFEIFRKQCTSTGFWFGLLFWTPTEVSISSGRYPPCRRTRRKHHEGSLGLARFNMFFPFMGLTEPVRFSDGNWCVELTSVLLLMCFYILPLFPPFSRCWITGFLLPSPAFR